MTEYILSEIKEGKRDEGKKFFLFVRKRTKEERVKNNPVSRIVLEHNREFSPRRKRIEREKMGRKDGPENGIYFEHTSFACRPSYTILKFWVFQREERTSLGSSNTWEQNFGGKEILQKEKNKKKRKKKERRSYCGHLHCTGYVP